MVARRRDYPRDPKASCGEVATVTRKAIWGLLAPVIIIGGIMGGVFTPTEAAAVAVAYSFFIGVFVYRAMDPRAFFPAVRRSFLLTAKIMFIIGAASSFSWLMARSNAPQLVSAGFMSIGGNILLFMLLVNVMLLVLGMLMETVAILLIVVPLLFPLSVSLGIDPVFFGVMMTLNLSIGLVTPPVGMVMYVVTGIAKAKVQDFSRELIPYLVAQILSLITITAFPVLVTWLPDLVFGPGRK
jgi:C4-dicarboxylate transporter DctM subunit